MPSAVAHRVRKDMALLGASELVLSATAVYFLSRSNDNARPPLAALLAPSWNEIHLALAVALAIVGMAATIGLYRPQICQDPRRLAISATIAGVIASPIAVWIHGTPLTDVGPDHILWFGKVVVGWLLAVMATRLMFGAILRHGRVPRRILSIVGDGPTSRMDELLQRHHGPLFERLAIPANQTERIAVAMQDGRLWGVVVADDVADAALVPQGAVRGLRMFREARFQEAYLGRIDPAGALAASLQDDRAGAVAVGRATGWLERAFDLTVSLGLLVATVPLMAVVAVLIAVDSPGGVLYRQERIGRHGQAFLLLKFRSMRADAEIGGTPRWAQKHDPRVTRIGHFIRQTRIDELPQLLNVLRGDMSIVGPRPERPGFVEELIRAIPCYAKRAAVKPGITGWAQVNYPYGASVEDAREKLAYDLYYVKNKSILLDLVILCSTVRVILFREGAR